jgi:Protein of unknown function (DUF1573)
MKKRSQRIHIMILVITATLLAITAAAKETDTKPAPAAFYPEKAYHFEPILEGTEVTHVFKVQNRGTADLLIQRVKPGWGCTAANYTRQIPPGGEGTITVKVNTSYHGGSILKKSVMVYTNDTANPTQSLFISGQVDNLYVLAPSRVRLVGTVGSEIKETLKLTTQEKYPLQLESIRAKHGQYIHYALKKISGGKNAVYEIDVENTRTQAGIFVDTLFVKTDSKIKPEINIPVYGYIQPKPDTTQH